MRNLLFTFLFAILATTVAKGQNTFDFECIEIKTCSDSVIEKFNSALGTINNEGAYAIRIPKTYVDKYAVGETITAESLADANTIDVLYGGVVYTASYYSGFGQSDNNYFYRQDALGAIWAANGVTIDHATPVEVSVGTGLDCVDERTPVKGMWASWWSGTNTDFYFPTFVTKHANKYLHVGGRYYEMPGNGFEYDGSQIFSLPINLGGTPPSDFEMVTYDDISLSQRSFITDILTVNYDAPGTQAGESPLYHIRPDDAIDEYSGYYWQLVGDNKAIQSDDFQGFENTFYSFDVFGVGSGSRRFLVARNAPPAAITAGVEFVDAFTSLPDDIKGKYSHTVI